MQVRLDRKSRRSLRKAFSILRREGPETGLPRTKYDYSTDVGDGLSSSVIVATALWISRNFPEAPVVVQAPDKELEPEHPAAQLLRHPNQYYSGGALMGAGSLDYAVQGNAYIEIDRDGSAGGRPKALYYQPSSQITPEGSSKELITHYNHATGKGPRRIERENMIHVRFGLDPRDQKKGFCPLTCLLREVFTDDEAANFTAAVLRNFGFPGVIIQPGKDGDTIGPTLRDTLKTYFNRVFRGDSRGEALVLDGRVDVDPFEADLSKMAIDKLRQIPEERATAVMGVPAAVVGFGTGLEQTKVGATMAEMREMAYENALIPMQKSFSDELTERLLPEFDTREGSRIVFDLSNVRVLQEDENKKSERKVRQWNSGVITRAEARTALGEEARPGDEVYKLGMSDVLLPAGQEQKALPTWSRKAIEDQQKSTETEQRRELIRAFVKLRQRLEAVFADELAKYFGSVAEDLTALWIREEPEVAGNGSGQRKEDLIVVEVADADRALVDRILLGFGMEPPDFEAHYMRVAKETVATINTVMALNVMLTDTMEQQVLAMSGTRKGLIDMTEQTRQAMYRALSEGRAEGEGARQLANRIRGKIEAGPWNSVEVRSQVIARTETRYAQNREALMAYETAETVSAVQAFDAQLGPSDEECNIRNGQIMNFQEAEAAAEMEHPNGTLDFAPVVE